MCTVSRILNLVFVLQVVNVTGNQDICYYNFLCAHPLGALRYVVSLFSGYVIYHYS